jgi:hypothetical protein
MSAQILFFQKNKADYSVASVTAIASESSDLASYVLNRSNLSAWITTGSVDANNTTLEVDFGETRRVTDIILLKHNFKSFKAEYWDGSAYQAFSPAIDETTSTETTSYFEFTAVTTLKIRITIRGTQVVNSDKYLYQFIATEKIGQLNGWPVIKKPMVSRNKKKSEMLSGKMNIFENIGKFSCTLEVKAATDGEDLTIIETLYEQFEGFLVWLCGGDESQFKTVRKGYRLEDLFLMKCSDEYEPEYLDGVYKNGIKISMSLEEVID